MANFMTWLEFLVAWMTGAVFVPLTWAGPVEDGMTAYSRGDFKTAYRLLSGPAEAGDARAQHYMGALAQAGHGKGAARWFERAIAQGHADSLVAMGYIVLQGKERRRDVDEAFRWFKMGAERGSSQGLLNLSRHYEAGLLVPQDRARAAELRQRAIRAGNPDAQRLTTRAAINDDVAYWWRMFGRSEEAFAQRLRNAQAGDAVAKGKLSIHYRVGLGVRKNMAEALRWARAGAEQGDSESLYSLGLHYYNGWGVVANRSAALDWFRRAQAKAHPYAANAVALLTAPPLRAGGNPDNTALEIYMQSRRDHCFLIGATGADLNGSCY